MKPAMIQTECPEELMLIEQENDRLKREIDQGKVDMNHLLDSYEARREENLSLR